MYGWSNFLWALFGNLVRLYYVDFMEKCILHSNQVTQKYCSVEPCEILILNLFWHMRMSFIWFNLNVLKLISWQVGDYLNIHFFTSYFTHAYIRQDAKLLLEGCWVWFSYVNSKSRGFEESLYRIFVSINDTTDTRILKLFIFVHLY